jgi:hypothetical protein
MLESQRKRITPSIFAKREPPLLPFPTLIVEYHLSHRLSDICPPDVRHGHHRTTDSKVTPHTKRAVRTLAARDHHRLSLFISHHYVRSHAAAANIAAKTVSNVLSRVLDT